MGDVLTDGMSTRSFGSWATSAVQLENVSNLEIADQRSGGEEPSGYGGDENKRLGGPMVIEGMEVLLVAVGGWSGTAAGRGTSTGKDIRREKSSVDDWDDAKDRVNREEDETNSA